MTARKSRTATWLRLALLLAGLTAFASAICSAEETLTVTETTQVSSIAEACATYIGDLEIANLTWVNLTGVETIVGRVDYSNDLAEDDVIIHSSTLKNLTGGLSVSGARSDDTRVLGNLNVSLPALESSESLDIAPDWARVTVNTAPELNISTDFNLCGNGNMQAGDLYLNVSSIQLFSLCGIDFGYSGEGLLSSPVQRVENLWVSNCSGLTRSLLEDLEFAEYTIVFDSNLDLDYISMSLVDAGYIDIRNNGRDISVSLPNLKTLGGRSWKWADTVAVDASGVFRDVFNISMPELKEAHGDGRTSGKLNFTSNLFSELHLPRLETANCTLGIDENAALNDIWLPRLSYVKDLKIHANPRLLNVTAHFSHLDSNSN